ncbi:hypothetical protein A3SI_08024 [Nitritalea halalkaliphila LW7]|uniref:Uncharacterized protein n=1 Tax=Nitritalea halalkaliphila LW7 TaxID=1189621 RepID=I5C5V9_9BACT|nr:hypothetical protein [Nitritalea halalkaliphila]EIM77211.1 hypothetical protein A3SI_08024 [Nitritalea halalkaliphila LW7]
MRLSSFLLLFLLVASCRSFQPDPKLRNSPALPSPERTSSLAVPATLDAKEMATFLGASLPPVVDAPCL